MHGLQPAAPTPSSLSSTGLVAGAATVCEAVAGLIRPGFQL